MSRHDDSENSADESAHGQNRTAGAGNDSDSTHVSNEHAALISRLHQQRFVGRHKQPPHADGSPRPIKMETENVPGTELHRLMELSLLPSASSINLEGTNLAAYCRSAVSSDEAIKKQGHLIRQFCKRRGLQQPVYFEDNGSSGMNRERPGLSELVHYCEIHPDTVVLVTDADRLARSNTAWIDVCRRLAKAGARVALLR